MTRIITAVLFCCSFTVAANPPIDVEHGGGKTKYEPREVGDDKNLPIVVYIGNNQYPPARIEIFQQAGYTVGVYNLDAQRNLEEHLVQDLPTDNPQAAETLVQQRFEALPVEDVIKVFQPAALLLQWDIRKFPVFVFNREAAVYGVTDSARALELWETWKKEGSE